MSLSFTQNCALETGASSGIGEALARALADRGTALILTARRQQRLDELAETLSKQVPVSVIPADLSCESGVTDLIDALVARSETIDILVNCAGVALTGWFQEDEQGEQALMYLNMSYLNFI